MLSDFRLTLRLLAKTPGFTAIAIFTLAVGVGLNTATFSLIKSYLLADLPFLEPQRLIQVGQRAADGKWAGLSVAEFNELRAGQSTCVELAAFTTDPLEFSRPGSDAERIWGTRFSASGPVALRVPVQLGRWFNADEDRPGATCAVVLSDKFWRSNFAADPGVLGRQIILDRKAATIVGVAPAGFTFHQEPELWLPWQFPAVSDVPRTWRPLAALGRLKPGVTLTQARAEFATLGLRMAEAHPEAAKELRMDTVTLREAVFPAVPGAFKRMGWAAGFVLLIACANLANLLLARGTARQQEIAVRLALGAGRADVLRVLLLESLVIGLGGALAGFVVAAGLLAGFRLFIAPWAFAFPDFVTFKMDAVSLLTGGALGLLTALLAGLVPAVRAAFTKPQVWLKDGGRGSTRSALGGFMRGLVIAEVALACGLLAGVGLMIRSAQRMNAIPLGFEPTGVATGRLRLSHETHRERPAQLEFARQFLEQLEARPEIASAALTWETMFDGSRKLATMEGAEARTAQTATMAITADYFRTLGIPLRLGRAFDGRDHETAERVAVVNHVLAEKLWPGENPLGKRFRLPAETGKPPAPWLTVCGVVQASLQGRFTETVTPQIYIPWRQYDYPNWIVVWAKARNGGADALLPVLRQTLRSMDPHMPYWRTETLDYTVRRARNIRSLFLPCYVVFGVVALGLSTVGLYGVMAYTVSRRTSEFGVRMALGAQPRQVLGLVFRQGGTQVAWGLVIGLGLAYACRRQIASLLFDVPPHDWLTLAVVMSTLALAGAAACLVPAWRALRVNPVEALRRD